MNTESFTEEVIAFEKHVFQIEKPINRYTVKILRKYFRKVHGANQNFIFKVALLNIGMLLFSEISEGKGKLFRIVSNSEDVTLNI